MIIDFEIKKTNCLKAIIGLIAMFFICLYSGCGALEKNNQVIDEQPNLFIYLADDLSYSDLGVMGNPYVATDAIDEFAKSAISFSRMYTPTAMCAPSRSALLTGLYPHKNGCHMNHGSIKDDILTLPSYLIALGYKVALVGKRHIQPIRAFPFDYLGYDELEAYLSEVNQPVCVIYASNEPHGPHVYGQHDVNNVVLPAKWLDTPSTRTQLSGYYNDINTMDDEFEHFIEQIKKYELDKRSVTIFTSDHGFEYFAKWSCYEAGLQVPFYLQSKGMSFNADTIHAMTSFVDIVPTFIELAGGDVPVSIDGKSFVPLLTGRDTILHDYIYGAHTTRGIYSGFAYPIRSVTDGRWKYIRNLNYRSQFQNILTNGWSFDDAPETGSWAEWTDIRNKKIKGHTWASMYQSRPYEELYDLDDDREELYNLADHPEHNEIMIKLSRQMDRWLVEQGDKGLASEMKVPLKARDMFKVPKE